MRPSSSFEGFAGARTYSMRPRSNRRLQTDVQSIYRKFASALRKSIPCALLVRQRDTAVLLQTAQNSSCLEIFRGRSSSNSDLRLCQVVEKTHFLNPSIWKGNKQANLFTRRLTPPAPLVPSPVNNGITTRLKFHAAEPSACYGLILRAVVTR